MFCAQLATAALSETSGRTALAQAWVLAATQAQQLEAAIDMFYDLRKDCGREGAAAAAGEMVLGVLLPALEEAGRFDSVVAVFLSTQQRSTSLPPDEESARAAGEAGGPLTGPLLCALRCVRRVEGADSLQADLLQPLLQLGPPSAAAALRGASSGDAAAVAKALDDVVFPILEALSSCVKAAAAAAELVRPAADRKNDEPLEAVAARFAQLETEAVALWDAAAGGDAEWNVVEELATAVTAAAEDYRRTVAQTAVVARAAAGRSQKASKAPGATPLSALSAVGPDSGSSSSTTRRAAAQPGRAASGAPESDEAVRQLFAELTDAAIERIKDTTELDDYLRMMDVLQDRPVKPTRWSTEHPKDRKKQIAEAQTRLKRFADRCRKDLQATRTDEKGN